MHLTYNEKCYLSASPPVDLRDVLIITLINMGALLGSQAAGQVLNLDSLNNRLSGSLLSGPVEVSAQEQRRINENGQIVNLAEFQQLLMPLGQIHHSLL
jgi:hypothetical protein